VTPLRRILVALLALLPAIAAAEALPPRNPFLADSSYPMGHGTSAQQDSVATPGPLGPSRVLAPSEVAYAPVGPAHFGATTSGIYADGRRVFWGNGLDRLVKIDHESFEVIATYPLPDVEQYTEEQADASIARFDESTGGIFATGWALRDGLKLLDLSGVYTLLDRDHVYYIGDKHGTIRAYSDAEPGRADSSIVKKAEFRMPEPVSGLLIGMNMTFDGWLVVATEHGWVVAIRRDFSEYRIVRMRHAEGAEDKATSRAGYGWVRNGFPIDEAGGIYLVSQEHQHKVVWTGDALSIDPGDGAWSARYPNGWGHGSGATPSLMGFGDEDRLVVITDGEPLMNVTLFWRDAIPEDWSGVPDAPDRRIAGVQPADMGNPDLAAIQSEQSVVVAGFGALVVNNMPRNVPWYLPDAMKPILISYLGSNPAHQPFGAQKFEWDPDSRTLRRAWVNREISSPSCVPMVSLGSDRVYLIGAREDAWTLEALDWRSGALDFTWRIGGQRYNPLFSGTLIDEEGRVHYGTPWGRVRLSPNSAR
jgi:hypothetical protein